MSQTPATPSAPPAGVAPVAPSAPQAAAPPAGVAPVGPVTNGIDNTGPTAPGIAGPAEPANAEATEPKKRTRKPRVKFRAADAPKLAAPAIPEGYGKEHLPLLKEDFVDEATYCEYEANRAEERKNYWLNEAKLCREGGSSEQRKAANDLKKALEKLAAIKSVLGEDGYRKLVQAQQQQAAANQQAAQAGI